MSLAVGAMGENIRDSRTSTRTADIFVLTRLKTLAAFVIISVYKLTDLVVNAK